ncbi:MAG: PEGA domain-containing protein [Candidatus Omnitrophota bacterium]|nr:PEGA domain-containing protein [Candidatus Omnitrophota bacterium]
MKVVLSQVYRIYVLMIIGLLVASISGCATIVNGTSQKIQVTSDPSGATVLVDEKESHTAPVKLRLERRRDHTLVFSKDGYESQTVKLTHVISEAVAGNTLCWGPLGWVFDICAGTQYKLQPNPVHIALKQKE